MADSKISALTAVTTPAGADEFAVNESGTSKKITLTQINAYCEPVSAASTSAVTGYAADTYLAGSGVTITAARLQAGSFYRLKFDASKTAAGTATPILSLRMGTAGTTADTAVCVFTLGAGTAVTDSGLFEVLANFRSVGSVTSAVVAGTAFLMHGVSGGGLASGGIANILPIKVTSSGFDSTAVTKIGLSLNAGTSAAWTVTTVQADMLNLT